jgi:hypothetical protein
MSDRIAPPAPDPAPAPGGAREFRERRTRRRQSRTDLAVTGIAVVVLVLAVVVLLTVKPVVPGSGPPDDSSNAPPIVVRFGTPVVSEVTCGSGGNVTAERVPWINSSQPITTGDADPRITEIADGDFVSDPHATPTVNATDVCTGAAMDLTSRWYAVLEDPNGTNALTYTVADGWQTVAGGEWNVLIPDGANLTVVENPSMAGSGYALSMIGFANGAAITGSVTL